MAKGGVIRADRYPTDDFPWGRLSWFVSGAIGNSETLTVGQCVLGPEQANQPHYHPNCDEVLHVLKGRIAHRLDEEYVDMEAGDTISIPQGSVHNARNLGSDDAVLIIIFSTPDRQVVGLE